MRQLWTKQIKMTETKEEKSQTIKHGADMSEKMWNLK